MNEITLAEYRQQIEGAIERTNYEEAVAHGRRILEEYPKDIGAYWLLGKAMLEAGQDEHAADMFRRVLSADPEHLLAWVGMSELAKRRGELEAAVWYLERAFELATDNEMVATELTQLYGELEGSEPERLQLTQGALARLYLRGDLLTRAIRELRRLLKEHPDRLDLKVALAEALWRNGERLQASEVCQEILEEQPYDLKANLVLGEIWTSSGRAEGELFLEQAQAVDPENRMAQELFGVASPLPPAAPFITPLDYAVAAEGERPAWMAELEGLPAPEEFALVETGEALEAQIEIPAWLQEIAGEAAPETPRAVELLEEEAAAPRDEALEALDELMAAEPAIAEEIPEEEVLEWLSELEEEIPAEPVEEAEIPAWLTELGLEPPPEEAMFEAEEVPLGEELELAEIPDWLRALAPPEAEPPEAAPPGAPFAVWEEETPVEEVPPDEELAEVTELPAWLESDEMPSGDEAVAWLEQLAEGKEEELLAQAEAESEARMAEIMGRAAPALEEAPAVEEAPPEAPEEPAEVPAAEEPVLAEEMVVSDEAALEVEEPVEVEEAPLVEAPELVAELPAWVVTEDMPSAEEALGWLEQLAEVEEEKVRAEVEVEAEVEAEALIEEEAFGWTAFTEAPIAVGEAEEPVPAAPPEEAVEEAPPVEEPEEIEVPAPAAEVPEEIALAEVPEAPALEAVPEAVEEEVLLIEEEPVPAPEPAWEEVEEVVAPEEAPLAEAIEERPVEDLVGFIAARRAYAEGHPEDHEAWLDLGRVLWQADQRAEAIETYNHLIASSELLDDVVPDLEDYVAQWPDASLQQALGDAYMRADRLSDALDIYRRALASL